MAKGKLKPSDRSSVAQSKSSFRSRITAVFQELAERLQYYFDSIFAKGSLAQLILLVILSVLIVLLGMLTFFFEQISRGLRQSIELSMEYAFGFGLDYAAPISFIAISIMVSVMGMIIFGVLVGFISTAIKSHLESLKKGNSAVKEDGHILIIGWNNKVVSILSLLAQYKNKLKAVILAPKDVEEMQETLRVAGIYYLKIKIILRSGNPSNLGELKRVAFHRASSIIILPYERGEREDGSSDKDIEVIKMLMLLSAFQDWVGERPKFVGEISQKQNFEIANIAAHNLIPIVSSSAIISKVIVKSSRNRGLSAVYSHLFSFSGNSIYIQQFSECVDKEFGEIAYAFPNAIPIGVSWPKKENGFIRHIPALNPESDYAIADDEWLIFIARDKQIEFDPDFHPHTTKNTRPKEYVKRVLTRILILGWNSNVYDILNEFDGYVSVGTEIKIISNYDDEKAQKLLQENINKSFEKIRLSCENGNTVTRNVLEQLDIFSYDCIITLADESYHERNPDARTIMSLVLLKDIKQSQAGGERLQIISEILDPKNRELIERSGVSDIIISPEIVSMQLTQISQQQILHRIYYELLTAGGIEICLKPIDCYTELGRPCRFEELIFSAQELFETALGVRISQDQWDQSRDYGVQLNPPKDRVWEFTEDDRIIVLTQQIYD